MSTARNVDLHAHSTCSDGVLTPTQLVAAGREAGLSVLALTDHDTAAGVAEARAAAGDALEIVAGIEISTRSGNREVHLLGLFIDPEAPVLAQLSEKQREWRRERADVMVARARAQGLDIDMERVLAAAGGAPIGRPHLAQILVDTGAVRESQEAFDRHFGNGRPCYVPKRMVDTVDAIEAVHTAGGVAVCAHPASSRVGEQRLRRLVEAGLDGAEVIHPRHSKRRRYLLRGLCDRLGLLPSGGSDFHGPGRGDARLGDGNVPGEWCDGLRQRAENYPPAEGRHP